MNIPRNVPVYPMKTVVKLTGVEAHRIRYWETKYGVPVPSRDAQGRRLYTLEQVDLIKRIGTLTDDQGLSLIAIWNLVGDQPQHGFVPEMSKE